MNSKQKTRFKSLLEKKRNELAEDFNATRSRGVQGSDETDKDYIDYAVSSYTREFSLSLSEMEGRTLKLVEDALRRIQRGEYGYCLQCATEIPAPRLDVEPWARHCIRCQELEEQGLLEERDVEVDEDEETSRVIAGKSAAAGGGASEEVAVSIEEMDDESKDEDGLI